MEYHEFQAMNSEIVLAAEGTHPVVSAAFSRAETLVKGLERRLTRFTNTSELARLNRSSGRWFVASEALFEIVCQAQDFVHETGGLFNPAILPTLENAGYDRSMDEIRAHGAGHRSAGDSPTVMLPSVSDWEAVRLDPSTRAIHLPAGMRLDLGGIGKGWIAEQAALELASVSDACASSAGGDMFMVGRPAGEASWQVALEDPRDPDQSLALLALGPGAVATSAITKRRWWQDGQLRHHVIDPRLGRPAETDLLSVTVVAPHAAVAEVYAKALLIAGSREATRVAARRGDIAFIAVDQTGKLWGSSQARELINATIECA